MGTLNENSMNDAVLTIIHKLSTEHNYVNITHFYKILSIFTAVKIMVYYVIFWKTLCPT